MSPLLLPNVMDAAMIGLTFQGQLGNQMFQYAAARVQSERLGCKLLVEAKFSGRGGLGELLHLKPSHDLFQLFPHLQSPATSYVFNLLKCCAPSLHLESRRFVFPRSVSLSDENEGYDENIWQIKNGTWLKGYFQSPRYLEGWEDRVRFWFRPPSNVRLAVDSVLASLPQPPENMLAVHIRLTDYLKQRGSYAGEKTGWSLDPGYYKRALDQFPSSIPIALFSDDTQRARLLLPRDPDWISPSLSPGIDLFSMSAFQNMIIANSTFSWWAAWLNTNNSKLVVAPEYFVGWRKKKWYPADIVVNDWCYV